MTLPWIFVSPIIIDDLCQAADVFLGHADEAVVAVEQDLDARLAPLWHKGGLEENTILGTPCQCRSHSNYLLPLYYLLIIINTMPTTLLERLSVRNRTFSLPLDFFWAAYSSKRIPPSRDLSRLCSLPSRESQSVSIERCHGSSLASPNDGEVVLVCKWFKAICNGENTFKTKWKYSAKIGDCDCCGGVHVCMNSPHSWRTYAVSLRITRQIS